MTPATEVLKEVVALAKRRGFIFPGSEIYGGFANTYSYGPYGVAMKMAVKNLWWDRFVKSRPDMVGLDGPILLHPMVWKASGHVDGFSDLLVDCKGCKARLRVDHLIEAAIGRDVEGLAPEAIDQILSEEKICCPKCKAKNWSQVRHFNLMFQTMMNKTSDKESEGAYLRPETAQAIFIDFKNIVNSCRVRVPFGIAQMGKAFRNEITPGNFIFRTIEFEQMEIEYFVHPKEWESHFEKWISDLFGFCELIGLPKEKIHLYEHAKEKLSHYSKRTVDLLFDFPFGKSELYGLAYRTDFDLKRHAEISRENLNYRDPETNEVYLPHVIEPSLGVDRTILALLTAAYREEKLSEDDTRVVLSLSPRVAPVQVAIFPLVKKEPLLSKAKELYDRLRPIYRTEFDVSGAIGKRYRRQDEIGTPICITVDFESVESDVGVTLRDRDLMTQIRVPFEKLEEHLAKALI